MLRRRKWIYMYVDGLDSLGRFRKRKLKISVDQWLGRKPNSGTNSADRRNPETAVEGVENSPVSSTSELSLETRAESAIQHISDVQKNTAQHVGTTEDSTDYALHIQPAEKQDAGKVTVNLLPSEPPRQDLADQPQPSGSGHLPKAKRTRVTWDADSTKALEDSLGPLEALTRIPSGEEIKNIRQSKPVLHKFDVSQIYKKLYKIRSKKK